MDIFKEEEEKSFLTLRNIIYVCQTSGTLPHHLQRTATRVISAARLILETRFSFYTTIDEVSDIRTYLFVRLWDHGILASYQTILLESIPLIFDLSISKFRECKVEDSYPHLIIRLYSRLKSYQELINDAILASFFANFDLTFRTAYNLANCTFYKYDEVYHISSDAYSLVASMKMNPAHVIKKEYFRLSIPKLNILDILIEIFHLQDGLAFFKVNSGNLFRSTGSVETIFRTITGGDHQILELGRSLMFPFLRAGDFEICTINDIGAVIAFTEAKDVELEIFSLDKTSWITQWKPCLQNHMGNIANDSLFIKTHLRLKNSNNIHVSNAGLGLTLDEELSATDLALPFKNHKSSPPYNTDCTLHRSKPLQIPLSSAIQDDLDGISLDGDMPLDEENSYGSSSDSESIISGYGFRDNTYGNNQLFSYSPRCIDNSSMEVVMTDENTVISVKNAQVSRWLKNSWQKISPFHLQISIIRLNMGNFMVAHDPDYRKKYQLKIRLCDDIKCLQSTEQDIQLCIPPNAIMCDFTGVLSIRSKDINTLLPVLNYYITNHPETTLHSSTTGIIPSPLSSVSSAMDFNHSLLKCSAVIIPHELTQDVIN